MGMLMSAAAAACEYRIVTHGGQLLGGLAKTVANENVIDKWCDKFTNDEHELLVIVNSYSDDDARNHYAHVMVGVRKRGGGALPFQTFSSHVHLKGGGDGRDVVALATYRATRDLMSAIDDLDVSKIR